MMRPATPPDARHPPHRLHPPLHPLRDRLALRRGPGVPGDGFGNGVGVVSDERNDALRLGRDQRAISALRTLVVALSDALTDEGPDWSSEGLDNLRRRVANAIPRDECPDWLREYRDPSAVQSLHETRQRFEAALSRPGAIQRIFERVTLDKAFLPYYPEMLDFTLLENVCAELDEITAYRTGMELNP